MTISKVVLPVAGRGMRLRPLTLRTPKPLVRVAGRPILEYALLEARASGMREAILVVSPEHRAKIEAYIKNSGKKFSPLRFRVCVQEGAFGNGNAILAAEKFLNNEPFAVRFCDDLLFSREPVLRTLVRFSAHHRGSVFLLMRVPWKDISRYGVVRVEDPVAPEFFPVSRVVEKPKTGKEDIRTLSNLAVLGAYVFLPSILGHLQYAARHAPLLPDALPWTVACHREINNRGRVFGWDFSGLRLDCGTLSGLEVAEDVLRRGAVIVPPYLRDGHQGIPD